MKFFPGKNTGMGCYLLQGIFPTQGSHPCLLHRRWILYHLSHQARPKVEGCRAVIGTKRITHLLLHGCYFFNLSLSSPFLGPRGTFCSFNHVTLNWSLLESSISTKRKRKLARSFTRKSLWWHFSVFVSIFLSVWVINIYTYPYILTHTHTHTHIHTHSSS